MFKLHQNVWQWVSGFCPDPLESPREGKKKVGLTEGERWPQVWTPKIYDRSPPLEDWKDWKCHRKRERSGGNDSKYTNIASVKGM